MVFVRIMVFIYMIFRFNAMGLFICQENCNKSYQIWDFNYIIFLYGHFKETKKNKLDMKI